MSKENNTIYYTKNINLNEVIKTQNLKSIDEPLMVCDLEKIKEKFYIWNKYMPDIKPFYAVKCNNDKLILKTLADLGSNFDCASKTEIKQILDLSVEPERIIFANICKPVSHLKYAKLNNVNVSTVDTEFEIYKIHETYPESNIVIRYRHDAKDALRVLGAKCGCDAKTEAPVLMALAKSLNLKVIGVCFHVGSGCNDLSAYYEAITVAKRLFEIGTSMGHKMSLLDIGGGFPGNDDRKFAAIAEVINNSLQYNFPNNDVNVIAEPGRFFVTSAYTLICKIHGKREVKSFNGKCLTKMYFINDGQYGSFNHIQNQENITVKHLLKDKSKHLPTYNSLVWGPTCDSTDKVIENVELPDLKCDDFLAFPNMGAYSVPMATTFNGFLLPKTLYCKKDNYYIKNA